MPPQFSTRTSWDTSESELARAIRERQRAGLELFDLTVSNPTTCGFKYDSEAILAPLSNPAALTYDPDPKGIMSAREAVSAYYADHGATVDPGSLILTTSTSEAYSFLFRVLCNSGDAILAARPSYPLFDFLADLNDVCLEPFALFYDFGWWIDFADLEGRLTSRTKALVLVNPNNPTGHVTTCAERERIEAFCDQHDLVLIVDEVFLDYSLGTPIQSFAVGPHPCLTFVVSGLSKIAALPQMKVGWLACFGPEELRREALARMEVVADTFLSMNAPAQLALPAWLAGRESVVAQIVARVRENLAELETIGPHILVLPVDAGWCAVLRLPLGSTTDAARALVNDVGVSVHPGDFYGFPGNRFVVVSLIVRPEEFRRGVQYLKQWCEPDKLPPGAEQSGVG